MMSATVAASMMVSNTTGSRIQDETGAKYTVVRIQNDAVILQDTLDNVTLVSVERFKEMTELSINTTKKWEEMARVPYTISAWRA